jgi:hypothetical protein
MIMLIKTRIMMLFMKRYFMINQNNEHTRLIKKKERERVLSGIIPLDGTKVFLL